MRPSRSGDLLKIDPNASEATYSLSLALRNKDSQESRRLMQRFHALQQQEKTVKQVNDLGNQAYHAMNNRQWPEAISLMRQALALCGDCQYEATLHKDLGLAFMPERRYATGRDRTADGPSIEPRGPGYPEGTGGDPSPVVTRPIYFLDPHARLVDAYVVRILVGSESHSMAIVVSG